MSLGGFSSQRLISIIPFGSTLLLRAINFQNLLNLCFLSKWLPTIATTAGMSTSGAAMLGTSLQLGGVAGTLLMGPLIDRAGFRCVLVPSFLVATVTIALIGRHGVPTVALFAIVAATGLCIIGGGTGNQRARGELLSHADSFDGHRLEPRRRSHWLDCGTNAWRRADPAAVVQCSRDQERG